MKPVDGEPACRVNPARFPLVRLERIVQNAFVLFQQGVEHPIDVVSAVFFGNYRPERERTHRTAKCEFVFERITWLEW